MLTYLRLVFVAFFGLFLVSCATSGTLQQSSEFTPFAEISGAEQVALFNDIPKISQESEGHLLDIFKLGRDHTEIYSAMSRAETLKTRVAVRFNDGVITAILAESSIHSLSGFLQLDLRTKRLLFNFGPKYGFLVTRLTDDQMNVPKTKLAEIRSHYSIGDNSPFQFYYDTLANLEIFTGIYFEDGKLNLYIDGKNLTKDYDRYDQKDRCGTDLFWGIFDLIVYGRQPAPNPSAPH